MKREKSSKSALKPDLEQSLFKFRLFFHESTDEYKAKNGKPWLWYSYDMPEERDMFPPGLAPDLRYLHTELLKRAYKWPDLFNFLKECYPVYHLNANTDPTLKYYLPKHQIPFLNDISTRYAETLEALLAQLGVIDWQIRHATQSRTLPGFSPIKLPNYEFYGTSYFERNPQISYWFSTRKLKLVEVFDNRCYSPQNRVGTIGQDEFPEPKGVLSPPPRIVRPGQASNGRTNQPITVGSILSHVSQS
ncbi:hypothetical protein [Spirosoma litoris]